MNDFEKTQFQNLNFLSGYISGIWAPDEQIHPSDKRFDQTEDAIRNFLEANGFTLEVKQR